MKEKLFALLMIVLLVALAGCATTTIVEEPPVTPEPEPVPEPVIETELTAKATPSTGTVGETLEFAWELAGEEGTMISHSAVHYGTESVAEVTSETAPADTAYTSSTVAHEGSIPELFTTSIIPMNGGTLYYRYHATIVDVHYWSDEYSIEVAALEPEPEPEAEPEPVPEVGGPDQVITVLNMEFSPGEINAKIGDVIQWKNERDVISSPKPGLVILIRDGRSTAGAFGDFSTATFYGGDTYEYTVKEAGKLVYMDAFYANSGITGTINVVP